MRAWFSLIGRWNTAIWLGSGLFLTFGVGPAIFSRTVDRQVGRRNAGLVAQEVVKRFLYSQVGFAAVACLTICAGRDRYNPPVSRRTLLATAVTLLALASYAAFLVEPDLRALNQRRYDETAPKPYREAAGARFRRLHGAAQAANLLILIGVAWQFTQSNVFSNRAKD